jgi:hypothetical protein
MSNCAAVRADVRPWCISVVRLCAVSMCGKVAVLSALTPEPVCVGILLYVTQAVRCSPAWAVGPCNF